MRAAASNGLSLAFSVYPFLGAPPFPEFDTPRYNPADHPIGIAFSGGGTRSMSLSIGQAVPLGAGCHR